MSATDTIIERIKKLLRLGADARGNAHEAERAMALAFELAEKHRVDVESLNLDEETARVVHEFWHVGARFDRLRRGIFGILQSHFHVSVCLNRPRMLVVGRAQDIAIAQYVHDFLLRTGRACLQTFERAERWWKRRMTAAKRAGYTAGFIYGVNAALNRTRETMPLTGSQNALVLAEQKDRDAVIGEIAGRTGTVDALPEGRRNRDALMAGYAAGKSTTIHQPLGATPGAQLALQ